jgi:hypothetical protein
VAYDAPVAFLRRWGASSPHFQAVATDEVLELENMSPTNVAVDD